MYKYKAVHDIDMWGMYKQKQESILAFAVNNKVCSSLLSPFILVAEKLKRSDSVSDNLDLCSQDIRVLLAILYFY